jgi:hypothetical protein
VRCSLEAAVFVESDETTVSESQLGFCTLRRLLLQLGGANIAGTDRAVEAAPFLTRSQPAMPSEAGLLGRLAARLFVQDSRVRDQA